MSANGINDSEVAVGTDASNIATLFSQESGPLEIGTLGGSKSSGAAINYFGVVVGTSLINTTTNVEHAFEYANGKLIDLGVPAGQKRSTTSSSATAINRWGQVVGSYTPSGGSTAAFVRVKGVMFDLTSLLPAHSGWTLTTASGINDRGEIVGTGTYAGQTLGFLLRLSPQTTRYCVMARSAAEIAGEVDES